MKRLLIVEEELAGLEGHYFQYISDICHGARSLGWQVDILASRGAEDLVAEALPARLILPPSARKSAARPQRPAARLLGILTHNLQFGGVVLSHLRSNPAYDLVLAPTNLVDHVLGWWMVSCLGGRKIGRLALIFPDLVGEYAGDFRTLSFPRRTKLLGGMLKMLRRGVDKGAVILAVESPKMRAMYEALCGVPFREVPHVVSFPDSTLEVLWKKPANHVPVIGCFGPSRWDKGLDVLQEALRILRKDEACPPFQAMIQWTNSYELPQGEMAAPNETFFSGAGFELITHFITSAEYFMRLGQIDLMVLPYRRSFYYAKLSRVAMDAALAGLPSVYPAGTWLEEYAADFGAGESFQPDDAASLAQSIKAALKNLPALRKKALALAPQAVDAQSAGRMLSALMSP